MTEPIDIHWRQSLRPREPFAHFTLSSLLIWVAFLATLLAIYRALGFCFGFFPLIAASWLFVAWRWNVRGIKLCLVPVLCVFPTLVIGALSVSQEGNGRAGCIQNLKQIGLAIANYDSTFRTHVPLRTYDPQGQPLHSWRTLVLPYLEQRQIYDRVEFSEPWDSQKNSEVHGAMLYPVYRCPNEPEDVGMEWTSYLAIVRTRKNISEQSLAFEGFNNGTSNTALLAEVSNSGIHWMEPRDLHVTQMAPYLNGPPGQGPSSRHGRGVNVLFTDGRVDTLSTDTDPAVLRQILVGRTRQFDEKRDVKPSPAP